MKLKFVYIASTDCFCKTNCKMSTFLYLQAEGEQEVLVPGDPENKHILLCSELGGIPYHPKQIAFAVR